MFRISVLDIESVSLMYRAMVTSVILPGEEGELSVLDFHQPIVCCLKEGMLKIDQMRSITIKRGIARMQGNELSVLVER